MRLESSSMAANRTKVSATPAGLALETARGVPNTISALVAARRSNSSVEPIRYLLRTSLISMFLGSAKISDSLVGLSTDNRAEDRLSHGSALAARPSRATATIHTRVDQCGIVTHTMPRITSAAPIMTGINAYSLFTVSSKHEMPPASSKPAPIPTAGNP